MLLKVAVGSTNPIKIEAVRSMVQRVWPKADVIGVSVPSGVREMPMSDTETIEGAKNRAVAAREQTKADLGFGLEGGIQHDPMVGWVLQGWVVVVDGNGRTGIGGNGRLPLPPVLINRILAGEELGPILDDILNEKNVRQKGGAIGLLTAGLVMRQEAFALGVAYALAPFLMPSFYQT